MYKHEQAFICILNKRGYITRSAFMDLAPALTTTLNRSNISIYANRHLLYKLVWFVSHSDYALGRDTRGCRFGAIALKNIRGTNEITMHVSNAVGALNNARLCRKVSIAIISEPMPYGNRVTVYDIVSNCTLYEDIIKENIL